MPESDMNPVEPMQIDLPPPEDNANNVVAVDEAFVVSNPSLVRRVSVGS
jgi:hypothetical protein